MNITLAYRTLEAIERHVRADQGATFRGHLAKVMPHIGDAYRAEKETFRTHLGSSVIGRPCLREIWYGFHWATPSDHEGRMQRLFNRGHMEEGRFIALMLTIGVQVFQQDANGKQFRISEFGGHFGGSGDGVVIDIPDLAPGQAALSEFKTHNDKSFIKLAGKNWGKFLASALDKSLPAEVFEGEGVRAAKYEHWIQMQTYMRKMGLAVAIYFAVNKNDDHIYAELVQLDSRAADGAVERARQVIISSGAPSKIPNASPGWHVCRFCDHRPVCHKIGGAVPARNCRTCIHAEPVLEGNFAGRWQCNNKERQMTMLFGPKPGISSPGEDFSLTKERQLIGCNLYSKNPTM